MKSLLFMPLLLAIGGCASTSTLDAPDTSAASQQLVAAAQSIEHSLRLLAAAEAKHPTPQMDISVLVTEEAGLGERATLDWSGPIEPLLEKIARLTDYRLRTIGQAPPIPVMISLTHEERVLAEILKDAGLQAGNKADLVVYPTTRVIELRYLPIS